MRGARTILTLIAAAVGPGIAFAADASTFDPWLSAESPRCAAISPLKDVAKVIELTPAQFEFVRGLYTAIPPISHKLPSGDHAVMTAAGGIIMVALVDGDQSCARMQVADFILEEIMAVGRGDVTHVGEPL